MFFMISYHLDFAVETVIELIQSLLARDLFSLLKGLGQRWGLLHDVALENSFAFIDSISICVW